MTSEELKRSCDIVRRGPVGWVVIGNVEKSVQDGFDGKVLDIHSSINEALHELRFDPSVRVIGLTGVENGEFYSMGRRKCYDEDRRWRDRFNLTKTRTPTVLNSKRPQGQAPSGMESLVLTDKPVVARVNGDAIGWGQSLLWASDIIVAMDYAVISDIHMGQGDVIDHRGEARGMPFSVAPGDGAMATWPMFVSPPLAKEYQLLSRAWTAKRLYDLGAINYVVDSYEDLDAKVNELLDELLARPQHALARTKRVANKAIVAQWNLAMQESSAYERLDFVEHTLAGHTEPDWSPEQDAPARPDEGWCPDTSERPAT